jgi:hypothetical protein
MATEYATLVFKADTKEIGQAYNQLKKLNAEGKISDQTFKSFERQLKGVRAGAKGAGTEIGGMGRSAGQAGIQVQQLVGQIQGGTNPMLALSQQAADLGFVLGAPLLGAIAGLGASFAMVLLPNLLQGGRQLKEFDDVAKELNISLKEEAPNLYAARLEQLTKAESDARKALNDTGEEIDLNNALMAKQKRMFDEGVIGRQTLRVAIAQHEEREKELNVTLDQQYLTLREAAQATKDFANTKTEAEKAAEDQAEAIRQLVLELTLQGQQLSMSATGWAVYKAQLMGADKAVTDFIVTQTALNESLKEQNKAEEAADNFLEKLEKQASSMNLSKAGALSLEAATHSLSEAERERVAVLIQEIDLEEKRIEKIKENEAIRKQLVSAGLLEDENNLAESYQRRQQILDDARAKDAISEQEYQNSKKKIQEDAQKAALQIAAEGFTALGQYNKTAFKAGKALSIANAIMNTYEGATKALAAYPPPYNFIAAAGVVAGGMAQVQTIRSQQYQGRALGGQVRAGESYVVGERGAEVLTMGNSNGKIIPNDKLGGQQQVVNKVANVNFQISTVDASGFDSLLQSRRGQIINMVNTAMNDKGRRGVV